MLQLSVGNLDTKLLVCLSLMLLRDIIFLCSSFTYIPIGAQSSFSFSKGKRVFHISSTHCQGTERSVLECQYYTQSCSYQYDAGVICEGAWKEKE